MLGCLFLMGIPSGTSLFGMGQPFRFGPHSGAQAGATVASQHDTWGMQNPAGRQVAPLLKTGFFVYRGYGLRALRYVLLAATLPIGDASNERRSRLQLGLSTFGFSGYQRYNLTSGHSFTGRSRAYPRWHVGWVIRYQTEIIPSYPTTRSLYGRAGWMLELSPSMRLGAAFYTGIPVFTHTTPRHDGVVGIGLSPGSDTELLFAIAREAHHPLSKHAAVRFTLHQSVTLLLGAASMPHRLTMGVIFTLRRVRATVALEHHYALGWTPGVALSVCDNKP